MCKNYRLFVLFVTIATFLFRSSLSAQPVPKIIGMGNTKQAIITTGNTETSAENTCWEQGFLPNA